MRDWLEQLSRRRLRRHAALVEYGDRPRPSLPPGTDLLPQIRHVVVVMMENHSYDNYFGMLADRGDGFVLGPDGRPVAANPDADGTPIRCHELSSTRQHQGIPCQSWQASHLQWNAGAMDGFVTAAQALTPGADPAICMGYWTERDLPFYYGLARTFPLADRWFGSCLGPTFPNRRFLIAGTAHGLVDDLPFHLLDYPPAGTIFDMLTRHGISWANYHPVARDESTVVHAARHRHRQLGRRLGRLARTFPNAGQGLQKELQFTADLYPLEFARCVRHVHSLEQFFAAADNGTLPAFSIVDPSFDGFSEENPLDIRKGESFSSEVINRVMHGKGWPGTLLIWTYDEHGGYYDHVPPPAAVPPDDVAGRSLAARPAWLRFLYRLLFPGFVQGADDLDDSPLPYDRYGFRVPAVVVSPYARPHCVLSEVFDHTSILKLVEEKWNLPALTRRDAAAMSPIGALDFAAPPAFLTPPSLPEPSLKWGSW